jgi:predicted transcriptional regulator
MRVSINIPDEQIKKLAVICQVKKISRSKAIRHAIELYIEQNKSDAFGLWQNCKVDSMTYHGNVVFDTEHVH